MFNDEDFALTVKVASLPNSKHRLQVYFLHNDEFFKRRYDYLDENETFFEDNSERMIFFNRGVMETLKKFGWAPDFIVCNGWMTSLVPLYARTLYSNDPVFSESKIFFNIFKKDNECQMEEKFIEKALLDKNIAANKAEHFAEGNFDAMCKGAIHYSDGLIVSSTELHEELMSCIGNSKKPVFNLEDNGATSVELSNFIKESKPVAKGA
jgi:starch synthase